MHTCYLLNKWMEKQALEIRDQFEISLLDRGGFFCIGATHRFAVLDKAPLEEYQDDKVKQWKFDHVRLEICEIEEIDPEFKTVFCSGDRFDTFESTHPPADCSVAR